MVLGSGTVFHQKFGGGGKNYQSFVLSIICALIILFISPTITAHAVQVQHDCLRYITSKQDDNYHWQECSLCGSIPGGKQPHDMIDNGWTYGSADYCQEDNIHRYVCSCGFIKTTTEGRKTHTMDHYYNEAWSCRAYCYVTCSSCWAYDTARILDDPDPSRWDLNTHIHTDAWGNRLTASNPGTCVYCGIYMNIADSFYAHNMPATGEPYGNGHIYYCYCGIEEYRFINYPAEHADGYTHVRVDVRPNPDFGIMYDTENTFYLYPRTVSEFLDVSHTFTYIGDGWYRIDGYITPIKYAEISFILADTEIITDRAVLNLNFGSGCHLIDSLPPAVSGVSQRDVYTAGSWCTAKELTIYGTENWCKTVNFNLRDADGNYYVINAQAPVTGAETGGSWSFSYIPDIEADENGKQFVFEIWDSFYNKTEYPFTIYKTDKKPPVGITESTGQEWSKTKTVTLTATDAGSRDVWFGIDSQDYVYQGVRNGNTFTYDYVVGGDVYGGKTIIVYTKDGVNNESGHEVTYWNTDNTAPTVTGIAKARSGYDIKVFIYANDINRSLNLNGSGVTGYAVTSQETAPDLSAFQESNVFTITENGTYYFWARDLVGNISRSRASTTVTELMTSYKAEHYLQNLDGTYETPVDTDVYEDIHVGTSVTPAVKSYDGFDSPETQTVKVGFDNTTVVRYYYAHKSYNLLLLKSTGVASVTGAGTYSYGQTVAIDAVVSTGWTFKEWTGTYNTATKNYTFTMPASDVKLTANAHDIAGPEVFTASHTPHPEWTNIDATITVYAEDWGVGLADEPYSYDKGITWTSSKTVTVPVNGTYPIWARDKEGNISKLDYEVTNIDKVPPVITGLSAFYDKDYIDREYENPINLAVYVTDDASGVAGSVLTVTNHDSGKTKTFIGEDDGTINVNITNGDLFYGGFDVTVTAEDVAGNVTADSFDTTEFLLESSVTRLLGTPNDVFKTGESGRLDFTAWGWVDKVKVTFPPEFQTKHVFDAEYTYDVKFLSQSGSIPFMVPIGTPYRGDYEILIEAWKDDHKLSCHVHLSVVNGTVLDELRTRLK